MDVPKGAIGILETERLRLRPLAEDDVPRLVELANDLDVASGTLTIPHPYEESHAREFIERARRGGKGGKEKIFAIVEPDRDDLIGTCGIAVDQENRSGEIGYWIGAPYRGRGYVHEAVTQLIESSIEALGVEKIVARVFAGNDRSSRLLVRLGFQREGLLRQHLVKWGERKDVEQWGLLADEWKEIRS